MKLSGDQSRLLKAALMVAIQSYKEDKILAADIAVHLVPIVDAETKKVKLLPAPARPFVDTGICTGILFGLIIAEQYGVPDWVKECIKK